MQSHLCLPCKQICTTHQPLFAKLVQTGKACKKKSCKWNSSLRVIPLQPTWRLASALQTTTHCSGSTSARVRFLHAVRFRITTKESLLTAQLLTARDMIEQNKPPIHSLMDLGDYLLSLRLAFTLVLECIAVAITIPVSSCSAERCFSAVKRILTRCAPQCQMSASLSSPCSLHR